MIDRREFMAITGATALGREANEVKGDAKPKKTSNLTQQSKYEFHSMTLLYAGRCRKIRHGRFVINVITDELNERLSYSYDCEANRALTLNSVQRAIKGDEPPMDKYYPGLKGPFIYFRLVEQFLQDDKKTIDFSHVIIEMGDSSGMAKGLLNLVGPNESVASDANGRV